MICVIGFIMRMSFYSITAPVRQLYIEAENYTSNMEENDPTKVERDDNTEDNEAFLGGVINIRHEDHKTGRHHSTPTSPKSLTLIENTLNTVRCVAEGGYPAPEVRIKVGGRDITEHFRTTTRPRLTGVQGLRVITYSTELHTEHFLPQQEDDGKKLRCIAAVYNPKPNVTAVKLEILCKFEAWHSVPSQTVRVLITIASR